MVGSRKHEVPTHLEVPDKVIFGLTLRQLLVVGGGIALAYTVWEHLGPPGQRGLSHASLASPVPWPLRLAIALIPCLLSLVVAFARYRGRWAEEWLLASLHYALLPKEAVWRPSAGAEGSGADDGEDGLSAPYANGERQGAGDDVEASAAPEITWPEASWPE